MVKGDPSQVTVEGSNSHDIACVVDGRVMAESTTDNTKDFMVMMFVEFFMALTCCSLLPSRFGCG